jgi:hypothetical protein
MIFFARFITAAILLIILADILFFIFYKPPRILRKL